MVIIDESNTCIFGSFGSFVGSSTYEYDMAPGAPLTRHDVPVIDSSTVWNNPGPSLMQPGAADLFLDDTATSIGKWVVLDSQGKKNLRTPAICQAKQLAEVVDRHPSVITYHLRQAMEDKYDEIRLVFKDNMNNVEWTATQRLTPGTVVDRYERFSYPSKPMRRSRNKRKNAQTPSAASGAVSKKISKKSRSTLQPSSAGLKSETTFAETQSRSSTRSRSNSECRTATLDSDDSTEHGQFSDLIALANRADEARKRQGLWPWPFTIAYGPLSGGNDSTLEWAFGLSNVLANLERNGVTALASEQNVRKNLSAPNKTYASPEIPGSRSFKLKRWKCVDFLSERIGQNPDLAPEDIVTDMKPYTRFDVAISDCYRYGIQTNENTSAIPTLNMFALSIESLVMNTKIDRGTLLGRLYNNGTQGPFREGGKVWFVRRLEWLKSEQGEWSLRPAASYVTSYHV